MIQPKKFIEEIPAQENPDLSVSDWRLKLDLNENIYEVSDLVLNSLKNTTKQEVSLYCNCDKLINKLASKYELKQENITLTNDTDEAIKLIFDTYIENSDEILTYNYPYAPLSLCAQLYGAEIKKIEYGEDFDVEKVVQNVSDKTKLIYFSAPDIFTGNLPRASLFGALAQKCLDIIIALDCSYINFAENEVFEDYIDITKELNNVIILKSFSNDYSLAGLNISFVVSCSNIIKNLNKIKTPHSVNIAAINCAISALNDEKHVQEMKKLNIQAKHGLYQGLKESGFKPYLSQANFVLCDFGKYCDFYFEKLKKNGVIVKRFEKNSVFSNCLRITVPKLSGVKYILELFKIKDVLIFDDDGVIFDVSESYIPALKETYKHFSKNEINISEVISVVNQSGINTHVDALNCLLDKRFYDINPQEMESVFKNLYFNPDDTIRDKEYLIDKEKLVISKEIFEKLAQKFDLVIFSQRSRAELEYSLNKHNIARYFYYCVCSDDLPQNMLKPNPCGLFNILNSCPYEDIKYFGDGVDDIIAGNSANIKTVGVIPANADFNALLNNFKHLGAKYILDDINSIYEFACDITDW